MNGLRDARLRRLPDVGLTRPDMGIAAVILILLTIAYHARIEFVVHSSGLGDCLMGSDTSIRVKNLANPHLFYTWGIPRRHLLTIVPTILIGLPLRTLGIAQIDAVIWAIAATQAAGAVFLYGFFRIAGVKQALALFGTAATFLTAGAIADTSAVDGYGITLAGACFVFFGLAALARSGPATFSKAIVAGLIAAVGGVGNAPIAAYGLLYPSILPAEMSLLKRALLSVVGAVIAVGITGGYPFAMDILHHDAGMKDFVANWASTKNFLTLDYGRYLVSLFLYDIASPIDYVSEIYRADMIGGYLHRPLALATVALFWLLFVVAVIRQSRYRDWLLLTIALVFVPIFLFHIYFDPLEVMLFSPEWVLLFTVPLVLGLASFRQSTVIVGGLAALLAVSNLPTLHTQSRIFPTQHCEQSHTWAQ